MLFINYHIDDVFLIDMHAAISDIYACIHGSSLCLNIFFLKGNLMIINWSLLHAVGYQLLCSFIALQQVLSS